MAGASKHIDISRFSKRISYLLDFSEIAIIPYPHLNSLGFVGMGHKSEYLIWRESQGFFTALNKKGNLLTWSLGTGKLILTERQKFKRTFKTSYSIYRASAEDTTYLKDEYNFDDRSLALLVGET